MLVLHYLAVMTFTWPCKSDVHQKKNPLEKRKVYKMIPSLACLVTLIEKMTAFFCTSVPKRDHFFFFFVYR